MDNRRRIMACVNASTANSAGHSWIPDHMTALIQATHDAGTQLLVEHGFTPEPPATALCVEQHRWHWKPSRPRLLLIAESHVLTTSADLGVCVDYIHAAGALVGGEPHPPTTYVGLIYCLGYGESEMVPKRHASFKNRNTISFWDVFGRVTGKGKQPRRSGGASLPERIKWKVETLGAMRQAGIWLLDASVHAIYRGRNERLPYDVRKRLQEQWWEGYGRAVVKEVDSPEIWCIGKTTFDILAPLMSLPENRWVYQPGARDVDLERNWPALLRRCEQLLNAQSRTTSA